MEIPTWAYHYYQTAKLSAAEAAGAVVTVARKVGSAVLSMLRTPSPPAPKKPEPLERGWEDVKGLE